MVLAKNEVCGKPTHYNLSTCEYDWKYLPDSHFELGERPRRNRGLRVFPHANPPEPQAMQQSVGPASSETPPFSSGNESLSLPPLFKCIPWSHERLRRLNQQNCLEANTSHLR
ncbi:hypothetical protein ERJ75_001233200 [Trypanosoma vivax]|uniref:Uncharacterized protein n=1 Tax=Trypanosoma vivax (strain Y486) TaxID=1055687 RepID=G0U1H3_TRYVY|nr:hypothetical protein TRVL_00751 [Trypanosoma vivax]KAH8608886.1 hypothetical protein ERJ75_001233200 [Trypanosoma vivax]CCC49930.1 conserved hypothetical protein [Trypanosoma vivax Y486]